MNMDMDKIIYFVYGSISILVKFISLSIAGLTGYEIDDKVIGFIVGAATFFLVDKIILEIIRKGIKWVKQKRNSMKLELVS